MTTPFSEISVSDRPKRRRDEEDLQTTLVEWLRWAAKPGSIWFHVPNQGKRGKATGGRLKAMGLRAGVADLLFVLPDGIAAFMELKTGTGKQSKPQIQFERDCFEARVPYVVVTNFDTAVEILTAWGVVK